MREFITELGERVKEGEKIAQYAKTPFGNVIFDIIKLDETTIPKLIEKGVLKETVSQPTPTNIEHCINHLAERIKWNKQNLLKYLDNLYKIYPVAVFSIILREVAIIIDEHYPNHIENSKEIWCISTLDGEIKKVKDVTKIKNFRNFAAFRTLEDAKIAKEVMKDAISDLFKKGGK